MGGQPNIHPDVQLNGQPGWLKITRTSYYNYFLGLLGLLAYLAWLVFPSRIPALALLVGLGGGIGLRWYAGYTVRTGARITVRAEYVALAVIVAVAAGLRFASLNQSLPYFDNPDEPTMTNTGLKMLQTGDLNPHFFRWPSLPFYMQYAASAVQFITGVGQGRYSDLQNLPTEGFFLVGRVVSATLGTATVFLTYLLGRTLYGPAVGLTGALVLAVLPLHTEHSHYVTPDIIVTFFTALTLLFAAYVFRTGQRKWYLWAGVAAGWTTGSKYNVAIVLVSVVLAHFLASKNRRGKFGWLVASVALAAGVFLVTTPFAVLDLPGFLNEMAFQIRHYTILGHGSASEAPSWSAYLQDFWLEGFVFQASIVAVGGVLFALFRQRRADWLTVSFPLLAYFFFSAAKVHFSRNLLPLLPSLAVLSGVLLVAVAGWLVGRWPGFKAGKWRFAWQSGVVLVLFAGFFFYAGLHSVLTDRFFAQPDTRQLAAQWIVADIPSGSKIRLEQGGPILPTGRYPNGDEQRPIGAHDAAWYRDQGFKYLVAISSQYDELIQTDPTAAANYQQVFSQFTLLKEFRESSKEYPGPTVRIYQVK
ncbi:MAG: glycosyltransferase family 39 protein [Chloroflexi bacterium]|nr:glycosyltransferase family 39 protein [Chloroflexota bacterium]OJV92356.1 MAG: hypothetical protein BGO39_30980 [Chloroflexi bacterium 54-19]